MITLTARCLYCNHEGVLDILGAPFEVPDSRIFKQIGHNPFSGHMHYQCPACEIVHLVDPMEIPGECFVSDSGTRPRRRHVPAAVHSGVVYQ